MRLHVSVAVATLFLTASVYTPPSHARGVTGVCGKLLERVGRRLQWHLDQTATPADEMRAWVAEHPAEGSPRDFETYANLSPADQRRVDLLQTGRPHQLVVIASRHPRLIPPLARRFGIGRKLRAAYFGVTIAVAGAGLVQPFILTPDESPTPATDALPPDQFELVLTPVHTFLRVGAHTYDYMFFSARRDETDYYENVTRTAIRVQVSVAEVAALKDYLEAESGSVGLYYLYPYIGSNCLSQLNRALRHTTGFKLPDGFDRSPTLSLEYSKVARWLGDSRIKSITHTQGTSALDASGFTKVVFVGDALLAGFYFSNSLIAAQLDRTSFKWQIVAPRQHPSE